MTRENGVDESSFREVRSKIKSVRPKPQGSMNSCLISSSTGSQFHFVSIQNPRDANNRKARRLAKSHAVARALENKRKVQQESGRNFCAVSLKRDYGRPGGRKEQSQTLLASPSCFSANASDPFQMLVAESPRLRALHDQCKIFAILGATWHRLISAVLDRAKQAAEPVFSVSDELVLQNFRSVLRNGLDDHALLSAFMLTFTFAVTASNIDRDYLEYQTMSLSSIRERLHHPGGATSESTLGAIVLLAGIEVCSVILLVLMISNWQASIQKC